MRELEVLRLFAAPGRARADVIEGRALLLPERGVGEIEPAFGHRKTAQRAATLLTRPEHAEKFCIRRSEALAHRSCGSGQPRRAQAASTVLRKRQAIVIGPTPPGTGVMKPATSAQLS